MTIIEHPKVLDPSKSYTFRSYFEMRYAPIDIFHDLGCTLVRQELDLPRAEWDTTSLKAQIALNLKYLTLTSEDARKQAVIGPVMLALAATIDTDLQIEYPLEGDPQYLRDDLDYYLATEQALLVVEAKNADLTRGFVQMGAELIGPSNSN